VTLDIQQQQLGACRERRRQNETALQETVAAIGTLSGTMADLKTRLSDADQRLSTVQEELTICLARQRALHAITRQPLPPREASESLGVTLAHLLTVRSEYDCAIEAVLCHKLMGTLVEAPQEAARWLKTLNGQSAAGRTFLPQHPRGCSVAPSRIRGEGVVGGALDFVSPSPGYEELISHLLAGVVIVHTLDQAVALWHAMSENAQSLFVTVNGEILMPDGTVTTSPVEASVGVIARERELRTLTDRVRELEHASQDAKDSRNVVDQALASETSIWEARDSESRRLEMDLVSVRKDEQRGEQDIIQLRQRIEVLMAERQAAEAERDVLRAAEQTDGQELQRLETDRASAEHALADLQAAVAVHEGAVEHRQADLAQVRLEVAGLTERLEQSRGEILRMEGVVAVRETRIGELEQEISRLWAAGAAALAERQTTEAGVPAVESELSKARRDLGEAQQAQTGRTIRLRALEAEFNKLRHGIEDVHRQQETVRLRQREAEIRLEGYERQLQGTYQVSLEEAMAEVAESENVLTGSGQEGEIGKGRVSARLGREGEVGGWDADIAGTRERLSQRRGRLNELGPVNIMAIDEHRELEERRRFLTAQEEDLAQSVASLKAIIAKINRTTKQLFLDTFQELQTQFDEMFRTFFEGGRAELVLVEDEEGGEPGVDIVAQPPGKRLKNITMLSGGERALTAMALVFASFIIRPTPFCVLDEIDAALDEENTVRFTRVLQGLSARSQFIVITHSKQTMEVADSLYGVTMEEPGVSTLVSVRLNRLLEPV
jgi:chromosome segregation protein